MVNNEEQIISEARKLFKKILGSFDDRYIVQGDVVILVKNLIAANGDAAGMLQIQKEWLSEIIPEAERLLAEERVDEGEKKGIKYTLDMTQTKVKDEIWFGLDKRKEVEDRLEALADEIRELVGRMLLESPEGSRNEIAKVIPFSGIIKK